MAHLDTAAATANLTGVSRGLIRAVVWSLYRECQNETVRVRVWKVNLSVRVSALHDALEAIFGEEPEDPSP